MDIKRLMGKRIQEIRKSKNLTQEYLAELIGIETVSLSNIERGRYYPSAENLNKILNALKITPGELFTCEHLASHEDMLQEMIENLSKNEDLTRLVYKFYKIVH